MFFAALWSALKQAAFAQCGVFEGGFTLEAAEAVLEGGDDVGEALLDLGKLALAEGGSAEASAREAAALITRMGLSPESAPARDLAALRASAPSPERPV